MAETSAPQVQAPKLDLKIYNKNINHRDIRLMLAEIAQKPNEQYRFRDPHEPKTPNDTLLTLQKAFRLSAEGVVILALIVNHKPNLFHTEETIAHAMEATRSSMWQVVDKALRMLEKRHFIVQKEEDALADYPRFEVNPIFFAYLEGEDIEAVAEELAAKRAREERLRAERLKKIRERHGIADDESRELYPKPYGLSPERKPEQETGDTTRCDTIEEFGDALTRVVFSPIGTARDFQTLQEKLPPLLAQNTHLEPVAKLKSYKLSDRAEAVICLLLTARIALSKDSFEVQELENFFRSEGYEGLKTLNELKSGRHELSKRGLVRAKTSGAADSFNQEIRISLSLSAAQVLLKPFGEEYLDSGSGFVELIQAEEIKEKELFFNADFRQKTEHLTQIIKEENFSRYIEEIQKDHRGKGMAILFYGEPGTGKTELALQIAKKTGRDIFNLHFSDINSIWVGHSEGLVQDAFDSYRQLTGKNGLKPIFLLNEADSIIQNRASTFNSYGYDKSNKIQNIILEELEKFDGILIATTNLPENIDRAYERRFLRKLRFPKPDAGTRALMWKAKFPSLTTEETDRLAQEYTLTGAEIDNVRTMCIEKKYAGDGSDAGFEDICRFAKEVSQKAFGNERPRLGY